MTRWSPDPTNDDEGAILDPFTERQMGARLRSALQDHAEQVEPAPNSYLTLSKRLEEVESAAPKRRWRGGGQLVAAAATLAVVAGVGLALLATTDPVDVGVGGADSDEALIAPTTTEPPQAPTTEPTVPPTSAPTTTTTVVSTTTTNPPPEVDATVVDSVALPAAQSAEAAAEDLVYRLGLSGRKRFVADGPMVEVLVPEDIDVSGPLTEISIAGNADDGFAATSATSDTMQISSVYADGDQLVVLGQGIAFEATVQVHLIGSDGARLSTTFATAGCCDEPAPFEARLPVRGVGEGFVVAHGDTAGGPVLPAFAALPIRFSGPADDTTYTVFRIRPDDADRGLNLRDQPDSDEGQILATLPPGSTGITRLPEMPALVGDSYWWNVETGDGDMGWVNSSFLTPNAADVTDEALTAWAKATVANIEGIEFGGLEELGMSRRVPIAFGWLGDPQMVTGPDILNPDRWLTAGLWAVPEATYGEAEKVISLRSLVLPEGEAYGPFEFAMGSSTRYGFEQDMVESYFAGTRAVTVNGLPTDDPQRDVQLMLFYEAGITGPELVGAVASLYVP